MTMLWNLNFSAKFHDQPYLVSRRVVQIVISLLLAAVIQRRKGETFHILNHLQFEQIQTILGGGRKSYFM